MTTDEKVTLRELFGEVNGLRSDMMARFDDQDVRLRYLEQRANFNEGADAQRKEHKVSIRWGITSIISVASIAAAVGGTVTAIILRFAH